MVHKIKSSLLREQGDFEWDFPASVATRTSGRDFIIPEPKVVMQTRPMSYQELVSSAAVTYQENYGLNHRNSCGQRGAQIMLKLRTSKGYYNM